MKRMALLLSLMIVFAATAADTKLQSGWFGSRKWSMQVPTAYVLVGTARPQELMSSTGFAPAARKDGSRPMIQVTLIDVSAGKQTPTLLRDIAEAMIAGVKRRREEWKVVESQTKVGDVKAIRYEWSGIMIPAADGATARMPASGVMIVGVAGNVAFSLHTQDSQSEAKATFASTEPAMATFKLE